MKKRCDNPYGSVESVIAAAKKEMDGFHTCMCEDCGVIFNHRQKSTKLCGVCSDARQKESKHQAAKKRSAELKAKKAKQDKGI